MSHDNPTDLRDIQPHSFRHIIGQRRVTEALQIAVDASFQEHKRLDEIMICGPPGLGKSALVNVLAKELAVPFTEILAQSITNTVELNAVLLGATDGILFLDEIHLLHPIHQHALLQVLDKRWIFLSGGKSVQSIPVAPFTLVGATTDPDGLIQPLVDPAFRHLECARRDFSTVPHDPHPWDKNGLFERNQPPRLPRWQELYQLPLFV